VNGDQAVILWIGLDSDIFVIENANRAVDLHSDRTFLQHARIRVFVFRDFDAIDGGAYFTSLESREDFAYVPILVAWPRGSGAKMLNN